MLALFTINPKNKKTRLKNLLLHKILRLITGTLCSLTILSCATQATQISQQQIAIDMQTLASDDMKGRASFTPGIDKAADYIAQRFSKIGLKPLNNEEDFFQTFSLYKIDSTLTKVKLDGEEVNSPDVFSLSTFEKKQFTNQSPIKKYWISSKDDFRQAMSQANQETENILVLIDRSHAESFQGYQKYFSRGITRFKKNEGLTAVFVITDKKSVDNFSIDISSNIIEHQLKNVAGIIPGKSKKEEVVLFSAHYDHLGINPQLDGDNIYNGADDDASGTTAIINIAEYYQKKANNERTLMFVAFTAEELGGFGSKYFSQHTNPENIVAMLNIEMIGKPSKFGKGNLWMTGFERSNLAEILNNNLTNAEIYSDPYPEHNLFYRSDNATLARQGVPAHSFSTSQMDIDKHYHQVTDEVAKLDLESMQKTINILAKATNSLVSGKDTPSRIDIQEIKTKGSFF